MENEFEYYLIKSDPDYNSPLLCNDDDIDSYGTSFLNRIKPIDENVVTHLEKKGEEYTGYYILYIGNKITSFDREKSVYNLFRHGREDEWLSVDKIVLNTEMLSKIPLEDRLIYKSLEHSGHTLYHKSVFDTIMSVNPEGVAFVPIEAWYQGMQFEGKI